jgi:OmcA/MtrC family decaheme c-type cytochrome
MRGCDGRLTAVRFRAVAREEAPMTSRSVVRAAALALLAAACRSEAPKVGGEIVQTPPPEPGMRVQLSSAVVNRLSRVVEVTFVVTRDGVPLTAADGEALGLGFTLAALETAPVDGAPAWRSLLLTGRQTLTSLPVAGPETPPGQVLSGVRQPGVDVGGAYVETGIAGAIRYRYAEPLPDTIADTTTLRAGAFMQSGAVSPATSTTLDFRPDNQTTQRREVVVDTDCQRCHLVVTHHEGTRSGTKLCVTCHTWQHADPDTVDPNAPLAVTAVAGTNPNPLEFGKLVHRIHRGKNLPTLYDAFPANEMSGTAPPFAKAPPWPFFGQATPVTLRSNTPGANRKFSVVGDLSRERVFARTVWKWDTAVVNSRLLPEGVLFPRDLRDCDACHARAADGDVTVKEISRRSCTSCHADVFFGTWAAGATDAAHFPHTGGPQVGATPDAGCATCHGESGTWVKISEAHVPPHSSPHWDGLEANILEVEGMKVPAAGGTATDIVVSYTLTDRRGPVDPPGSPSPMTDPGYPIKRAITSNGNSQLLFALAGPTTARPYDDFSAIDNAFLQETATLLVAGVPPPETYADSNGVFRYKLAAKLPASAKGTWAVSMQVSRSDVPQVIANPGDVVGTLKRELNFYDVGAQKFVWPFTGEAIRETANNAQAYVDVATGTNLPGPTRREVVELAKCNDCHQRLTAHGSRHQVSFCITCHTADKTDQLRRQKPGPASLTPRGMVDLGATYDGIEERSMHFKNMVHRIHTGSRRGSAELSAIEPFTMYFSNPYWFDGGAFPNDLKNCKLCHQPGTYAIEAVPANAAPTVANESGALLHTLLSPGVQAAAHPLDPETGEPLCRSTPPGTAACLGCHATNTAMVHAANHVVNGKETCVSCHGAKGAQSVAKVHGVIEPATP